MSSDFERAARLGDFRAALATVVGTAPEALRLSKELLLRFGGLPPDVQTKLQAWCHAPAAMAPITDEDRPLVERIARHEIAHMVVARAFGFMSNAISLTVRDESGRHTAFTSTNFDRETNSSENLLKYIDQRVQILLAGFLAEPDTDRERGSLVYQEWGVHAESDMHKAEELLQLRCNVANVKRQDGHDGKLHELKVQSYHMVRRNFSVIDALAKRFAAKAGFFGEAICWTGSDIEAQPEIQRIAR